jgi:diacylglycerol kinase (ATP)
MNSQAGTRKTVALIAHDARKEDLVLFARRHGSVLGRYRLIATASTGQLLKGVLESVVECKLSGPRGGDAQIAAEVASGLVCAVIFLIDPMSAQAHEADIQGLLRICNVHDVAVATNLSTAEFLLRGLDAQRPKVNQAQDVGRRGVMETAPKTSRYATVPHMVA